MPFYTIVIERHPDDALWPTEERVTRCLEAIGIKVVEYHHEKMTEDGEC